MFLKNDRALKYQISSNKFNQSCSTIGFYRFVKEELRRNLLYFIINILKKKKTMFVIFKATQL